MTIKGKKKAALGIGAAMCVYFLLLRLLIGFEAAAPEGSARIDTWGKALWYSLVTVTTVGYGDFYPQTPEGKAVSALFLLMSTGLLALLISLILSSVTGHLYPKFKLWRNRRKRWYVFYPVNEAAMKLAGAFDDGLVLFCQDQSSARAKGYLNLRETPERLFTQPPAGAGERLLFVMDENAMVNEAIASGLLNSNVRVYCRAEGSDDAPHENIVRFSEYECAARLYWQSHPWLPGGERVVIVGEGMYVRALLTQALLTAAPGSTLELFGDWTIWRQLHHGVFELPERNVGLVFHDGACLACPDVLAEADRIVLCEDSRTLNREMVRRLRQYYVIRGKLHAFCEQGLQAAEYFGDIGAIFNPELVMRQAQNRHARLLHEIYRRSATYPVPTWDRLSDFAIHSNLAAADHLITKLRILLPEEDVRQIGRDTCARAAERFERASNQERERLRRIEHDRWLLFYALYNWHYAPVRDNAARAHDLMLRYDDLSAQDQQKNDGPWELLRALSNEGEWD